MNINMALGVFCEILYFLIWELSSPLKQAEHLGNVASS